MAADFERERHTPEMLHAYWEKFYDSYNNLRHSGFTVPEIIELVATIRDTKYSYLLFPGSSMGRLLISKPNIDGQLNYQQTLTINKVWNSNMIEMKYDDWNLLNPGDKTQNSTLWSVNCEGKELNTKFEEFISWNKHWRIADLHL